ncbi:MAG: hypothetical protein ABSD78_15545 [Acidimicrobiales bacterium]|jgi:hypothetical protein
MTIAHAEVAPAANVENDPLEYSALMSKVVAKALFVALEREQELRGNL